MGDKICICSTHYYICLEMSIDDERNIARSRFLEVTNQLHTDRDKGFEEEFKVTVERSTKIVCVYFWCICINTSRNNYPSKSSFDTCIIYMYTIIT